MALDLLTFAMPFFFVLVIVYGALEIAGVFKNRGVMGVISIVIAYVAITNEMVVDFIFSVLPYAAIAFIILFFLGFLMSMFKGKGKRDYVLLIIITALVFLFLASQGYELIQDWLPSGSLTPENFTTIIGFALIIIILYSAYTISKPQPQKN